MRKARDRPAMGPQYANLPARPTPGVFNGNADHLSARPLTRPPPTPVRALAGTLRVASTSSTDGTSDALLRGADDARLGSPADSSRSESSAHVRTPRRELTTAIGPVRRGDHGFTRRRARRMRRDGRRSKARTSTWGSPVPKQQFAGHRRVRGLRLDDGPTACVSSEGRRARFRWGGRVIGARDGSTESRRGELCEMFHIPFQSGDDDILREMARGYTAKRFLEIPIEKTPQHAVPLFPPVPVPARDRPRCT